MFFLRTVKTLSFLALLPLAACAQAEMWVLFPQTHSYDVCLLPQDELYTQYWDTLPQLRFWRQVMRLSPDSALVNLATSRKVLAVIPLGRYDSLGEERKRLYKDSLRKTLGLPGGERIYITGGKNHFYRPSAMTEAIGRGIGIFCENGADPWYAQAILLIESPGAVRYSSKGAYGSFQLMKSVARSYGLVINDTLDERADFDKCAAAAARFLRDVCVPETRRLLAERGLRFDPEALWCRLLVLHVYHAGAANVRGVLGVIRPSSGGPELIRQIWQTEYKAFRNSSQNYTQLALAALLELDFLVAAAAEYMCEQP
jgi:hypothetical protein